MAAADLISLGIGSPAGLRAFILFGLSTGSGSDTTPDQFSGETKAGQPLSTTVDFTPVTPTGFNAATPITVSGGLYSINGGSYTSSAGTLSPGDTFAPRNTSSASYLTSVPTIITVGGVSATYTSITTYDPAALPKNRLIKFRFSWIWRL